MSDNGVNDPSERTKYKAQVYDLALNAFFKLREFDSDALQLPRAEIGWDIAEAFVAAAVSGATYKSASTDRRFEAASLLRALADQVDEDGLASLEWGYQGKLDARHAWRPDIRSAAGLSELDRRIDAVVEGLMRPLRALTVPERRAIVCMSFVRMALAHVRDLIEQEPADAEQIRDYAIKLLEPQLAALKGEEEVSQK
ncbi:MAG: hypothetical protein K9G59_15855 [Caulobacter sp.]|nr:hypothetical protein [Caulobacter sp.]